MTYTVTAPGETIRGLDAYQVLAAVFRIRCSHNTTAEHLRKSADHIIHRLASEIVCNGGVADIAVTVD